MSALKTVLLIHFVISAILITSATNANPNKKTVSSYLGFKNIRRKPRHLVNITPSGKQKVQLYCKTGFLLEVQDDGKIIGTRNISSKYTVIEVQIFGGTLRRFKGVASGRYISLNSRGRLSSTRNFHQNINTFFNEIGEENKWSSYTSSKHKRKCSSKKASTRGEELFIAIKKNGSLKRPCKTEPGMDSTFFLTLPRKREALLVEKNSLEQGT